MPFSYTWRPLLQPLSPDASPLFISAFFAPCRCYLCASPPLSLLPKAATSLRPIKITPPLGYRFLAPGDPFLALGCLFFRCSCPPPLMRPEITAFFAPGHRFLGSPLPFLLLVTLPLPPGAALLCSFLPPSMLPGIATVFAPLSRHQLCCYRPLPPCCPGRRYLRYSRSPYPPLLVTAFFALDYRFCLGLQLWFAAFPACGCFLCLAGLPPSLSLAATSFAALSWRFLCSLLPPP